MPGSSTTPGRLGARVHAPIRVAFRIRNGVGTRDNNLCEAQWLACAFPYRRFAAVLTDDRARLGADVVSYSFIVSDLHRLLVAGLPAHCERFCTLSQRLADAARQQTSALGSFASMIGAAGQSSLIEKGSQMLASLLGGRDQAALASAVAKYAGLGQGAGGSCWPRSTTMLSPSAVHMSMRKVKCVRVPPSLPLSRRWQRLRGWWRRRLRWTRLWLLRHRGSQGSSGTNGPYGIRS